ncbi:hypothetical protein [Cesiribacter sp. SM1]|uniref:hypothetical protein n=1 Tax=Cesiribacter sp. SM1 TaxID=2861196 RepID=UPI001CD2D191|nr:hypothetical protein [Cesiribacter sp. SM1]
MKHFIILFLMIATVSACEQPVCCDTGPPRFFTVIRTSEGMDYLTFNAGEPIDLYYEGEDDDDQKTDAQPYTFYMGDTTKLEGINVTSLSAEGIKTFYLKVGSDIDTLFVDVERKGSKWEYKAVRFNGEPAQEIKSPKADPYWLIQKK